MLDGVVSIFERGSCVVRIREGLLTSNIGTSVVVEGILRGTLEKQDGHILSIVLGCGIPDNRIGLFPISHEFLAFCGRGDGVKIGGLCEGRAEQSQEGGGDGELHLF